MGRRSSNRLRIIGMRVREYCEARRWDAEDLSHGAWISVETAKKLFDPNKPDAVVSIAIPVARALGTYVEDLIILASDVILPGNDIPRPPRVAQRQDGAFKIKRLLIRDRCDELGWSADDLARASGVNFSTGRGLYYGHTLDPKISTIIPIARVLGRQVEELVMAEEDDADIQTPLGNELLAA